MDKAKASVETMEEIQETMHSKEVETRDEGVQCTLSKLEDMEVDEGRIRNTLVLI